MLLNGFKVLILIEMNSIYDNDDDDEDNVYERERDLRGCCEGRIKSGINS